LEATDEKNSPKPCLCGFSVWGHIDDALHLIKGYKLPKYRPIGYVTTGSKPTVDTSYWSFML
jgi:hypothetical protein